MFLALEKLPLVDVSSINAVTQSVLFIFCLDVFQTPIEYTAMHRGFWVCFLAQVLNFFLTNKSFWVKQ